MAIDLGSSNTSRYYSVPDHADFSLPNGDWAWISLAYPENSAATKYLISTGPYQTANVFNLIWYPSGGFGISANVHLGLGDTTTNTSPAVDKWYWVYGTRRGGSFYSGRAAVDGSFSEESPGVAISAGYNSAVGPNIGRRSDGTADRHWKGRWAQVAFVSGDGITLDQTKELANGTPILGMPFAPSIKFLLFGRTAFDATIGDFIGGKTATRQGASYGANEEDVQTPYIWMPEYIRSTATSGGGSTGTVAYTNANDTSSASGTTTVTGSVAYTNTNDTSAASGTTTVTGSSATTNANDTSSATGSPIVDGVSATTNADDTSAASGSVGSAIVGTVAYTNIDDTAAASGTTTVTGSAAASNENDTSSAVGTTTIVGYSATTNADDVCAASGTAGGAEVTGTVAVTNADDVSTASGTTTVVGSSATTNTNDAVSAYGVVNNGTIVEAGLTTGSVSTIRIKKPGIPVGTPDWLKTTMEIMTGRRGNKIEVPKFQALEFTATPTKAEVEALYAYTNIVRDSLEQLINRMDG